MPRLSTRVDVHSEEFRDNARAMETLAAAMRREAERAAQGGSKAADLGARQFAEVTASLKQITELLGTTTAAAREIELSTKQQTTAVEQVNIAVSNVAQAAKETEVSSGQTLQTAGQLAGLSRDLIRLIQATASA